MNELDIASCLMAQDFCYQGSVVPHW